MVEASAKLTAAPCQERSQLPTRSDGAGAAQETAAAGQVWTTRPLLRSRRFQSSNASSNATGRLRTDADRAGRGSLLALPVLSASHATQALSQPAPLRDEVSVRSRPVP